MSVNMIYGYGGVKLLSEGTAITFENANSTIQFEPSYTLIEMLSGKIVKNIKGWRAKLSIKLFNTNSSDWQNLKKLISIVNKNIAIDIFPKFRQNQYNFLVEHCILQGNIEFKNIANFSCGQSIVLTFVSQNLLPKVPFETGLFVNDELVDSTQNKLIDDTGNNLCTTLKGV